MNSVLGARGSMGCVLGRGAGAAAAEARSGRQHYDIVATLPSASVVGLAENAPVLVG